MNWQACNPTVAVPFKKWFKVEVFFHRATTAGGAGRIWSAIDGQQIANVTDLPILVNGVSTPDGMYANGAAISRLMLPQQYGGDAWPRNQYVDDLEIWDGFPRMLPITRPDH